MNEADKDPLALAMWDYYNGDQQATIEVTTDISIPEEMKASYFFREFDEMNQMEKLALSLCNGAVIDIGAGAGCHSLYLHQRGLDVTSLESSESMTELIVKRGLNNVINARWQDFQPDDTFDQILLLMNGLGMAEKLSELPKMLKLLSSWLSDNGQILLDSSDISPLYELDDGSRVKDLGGSQEGEIVYTVAYKGLTNSFPWLYVTKEQLNEICKEIGLEVQILCEIEESFLASVRAHSPRILSFSP